MNLTRLLVLWLLAEEPLHGYRIKRILDAEAFRFWFPVQFGSIYSVMRSLVKEGHVVPAATERQGQRPERTRFAITTQGRKHLREMLKLAWVQLPSPAEPISAALAAGPELADDVVEELLVQRVRALGDRLTRLGKLRRSAPAEEMVDRQQAITRAELQWGRALLGSIGYAGQDAEGDGSMSSSLQHPVDVQLIASLVIQRLDGDVLLVRDADEEPRWWLPGSDLEPFEHPDEAAQRILATLPGLSVRTTELSHVSSFRGRRGWHVVFHYLVRAVGEPGGSRAAQWFAADGLPRMMHGRWEKDVVHQVLGR